MAGVDDATRFQLQCIAEETGGTYFGADSTDELIAKLGQAAAAEPEETVIKLAKAPGPGRLEVKGAGLQGHDVIDAETGEKVDALSHVKSVAALPAGIYNVSFSNAVWKSVVVKSGETTVLTPGVLTLKNAVSSYKVLDAEIGEEVAKLSNLLASVTLIPATFDVTFGGAVWRDVKVESGETTVLNAGVINVSGASATISDSTGKVVAKVNNFQSSAALPPGEYTLDVEGQQLPVTLAEGKVVKIKME